MGYIACLPQRGNLFVKSQPLNPLCTVGATLIEGCTYGAVKKDVDDGYKQIAPTVHPQPLNHCYSVKLAAMAKHAPKALHNPQQRR
ncbi:MAG: hypothetical protein ACTHLE_02765 [Agriterribacter sp.]